MELTARQGRQIEALRAGVGAAADFMARLTEYHGAPVETEYLITVEIARALLDADYTVALEYMPKSLSRSLAWDKSERFGLRNARFDIAAYQEIDPSYILVPTLLVEAKIGVRALGGKLKTDLRKVVSFMKGLKPEWAQHLLAVCVFQVDRGSGRTGKVHTWRKRADETEKRIRRELAAFGEDHSGFEFEMLPLYGSGGGVVEELDEPDGSVSLGRAGHVARCNAILIRRPPPPGTKNRLGFTPPWKRSGS